MRHVQIKIMFILPIIDGEETEKKSLQEIMGIEKKVLFALQKKTFTEMTRAPYRQKNIISTCDVGVCALVSRGKE